MSLSGGNAQTQELEFAVHGDGRAALSKIEDSVAYLLSLLLFYCLYPS